MAERTFWEKATILHALHHNIKNRPRMFRHYYDIAMMAKSPVANSAIEQPELLAQVVKNKSLMFQDGSASYETATMRGIKLLPNTGSIPVLRKDYSDMQEMFMGEVLDFDDILQSISTLEERINSAIL